MPNSKRPIAEPKTLVTSETFRFFRDLSRNNRTEWMESNRDRYKQCVVQPLRALCEELSPAILKLDPQFETSGRTGANLSRINRDIRFAKDKTPYRTGMLRQVQRSVQRRRRNRATVRRHFREDRYLRLPHLFRLQAQRVRAGANCRRPRRGQSRWLAQQKKRLGRRYESYWYSTERGEWKQHDGWPAAENWNKLQAWIVRREFSTAAATRQAFCGELTKIFRDLHPLLRFTSLQN